MRSVIAAIMIAVCSLGCMNCATSRATEAPATQSLPRTEMHFTVQGEAAQAMGKLTGALLLAQAESTAVTPAERRAAFLARLAAMMALSKSLYVDLAPEERKVVKAFAEKIRDAESSDDDDDQEGTDTSTATQTPDIPRAPGRPHGDPTKWAIR